MADNDTTPTSLIDPYCTVTWASLFFSKYTYAQYWTDASSEKKLSALTTATDFINLYVTFYDDDGNEKTYTPDGTDDWDDDVIPRRLKQACAQEAEYLLSLDDNPAEPHPLTILGLLSADNKHFSKEFTPPIFSTIVVQVLNQLNCDIDDGAIGNEQIQVRTGLTTC